MSCRAVLVGTHGELIQKLVAAYFEPESMPLVVVLYRGERPDYRGIDLRGMERNFVYFDVVAQDYEEVLARLRALPSPQSTLIQRRGVPG